MGILKEITDPADWIRRPVPGSNHAMWIAGHLAYADDAFLGMIDPGKASPREGFKDLFGKGSTPLDSLEAYPAHTDILEYLEDRRKAFYRALNDCSEEDFNKPTPEGAPAFMYDVGAVFQMCVWHESLHSGQLTVIHRMLGHQPLAGRPVA
jgi:uncharacterized damage-inducible protein DinB